MQWDVWSKFFKSTLSIFEQSFLFVIGLSSLKISKNIFFKLYFGKNWRITIPKLSEASDKTAFV